MDVNLTPSQVAAVGTLASFLVLLFRWLYEMLAKRKVTLPDLVMVLIVYAVSLGLAILWYPQTLPALPVFAGLDAPALTLAALQYAGSWITVLSIYVGWASIIYAVLFEKVKLGVGYLTMPRLYGAAPIKK